MRKPSNKIRLIGSTCRTALYHEIPECLHEWRKVIGMMAGRQAWQDHINSKLVAAQAKSAE